MILNLPHLINFDFFLKECYNIYKRGKEGDFISNLTLIQPHLDELHKRGFKPVYVALYGSQNYRLENEQSDVDTKAMVIPSLRDVVLNKKPVSKTISLENGEQCDVKDIRLMLEILKKQNINFLEILFSDHFFIDEEYEHEIKRLRTCREEIAHYNEFLAVRCMKGMAYEKLKAMEHPYPGVVDKIEKYGYDSKQLHHIARLREFMFRYTRREPFERCLVPSDKDYLMSIKNSELDLEAARILAKREIHEIDKMRERFDRKKVVVNHQVEGLFSDVLYKIFCKKFKQEIV